MATFDDVTSLLLALPGVVEGERYRHLAWSVDGKVFAWERPFSKADIKRFGDDTPPDGPIIAVSCADLGDKEAILAQEVPGCFTIAHFDNYPAVLIQLNTISTKQLGEALVDAWLTCAPSSLAEAYLSRS